MDICIARYLDQFEVFIVICNVRCLQEQMIEDTIESSFISQLKHGIEKQRF
ncbi:hypothetical protein pb186bvf_020762 [Paramecium bursaria]